VRGFLAQLGDRVARRAEPRTSIAMAGVGALMIVVGVIAWAGEQAAGETGDGESNRTLGIILSALVVAGGYLLLIRLERGPLATAGVAAAVLGVPVLMGFVTFDSDSAGDSDAFFALPFSVDGIALLSLAAWIASYLWVPVARGRVFFVAASSFVLWLYLLEKIEEGAAAYVVTLPYSAVGVGIASEFSEDVPDFTSIGGPSLVIGILYYGLAAVLDRQGHRGLATPFTAAGFVAIVVGVGHLASDLEGIGTGILLILLGAPLAVYGATQGRRFTTWAWAFGVGLGVLIVVGDLFEDNLAGFGISAILLGAGVILGAHLLGQQFTEPDEMTPGPSRFIPRPRPTPAAMWPGYPPQPHPGAPQWTPPPQAPPPQFPPQPPPGPPTTGSTPAVPPGPPTTGSTPAVPPTPPTPPAPPTTGPTPAAPPSPPTPAPPTEPVPPSEPEPPTEPPAGSPRPSE
jgi:hypothetical protein